MRLLCNYSHFARFVPCNATRVLVNQAGLSLVLHIQTHCVFLTAVETERFAWNSRAVSAHARWPADVPQPRLSRCCAILAAGGIL